MKIELEESEWDQILGAITDKEIKKTFLEAMEEAQIKRKRILRCVVDEHITGIVKHLGSFIPSLAEANADLNELSLQIEEGIGLFIDWNETDKNTAREYLYKSYKVHVERMINILHNT